jgi:replicative DNA helicase
MAALRGTSYGGTAHFRFGQSRATLASYAELLDEPALAAAAESDLFWDRIVSIESAGEEDVYDLTVPGPANWLADGVVSHNSGNLEQDSDVVMFVYRDEVYNKDPEADNDGDAELIIGKHRNGPIGHVDLYFQHQFAKFTGVDRGHVEVGSTVPTAVPPPQAEPGNGNGHSPPPDDFDDFGDL